MDARVVLPVIFDLPVSILGMVSAKPCKMIVIARISMEVGTKKPEYAFWNLLHS